MPDEPREQRRYEVAIGEHRIDLGDAPPAPRRRAGRAAAHDAPDPADTRLVQFTHALSAEDITRIRAEYGLALTAYIPNFTYVERVDADTERRLRADPLVRAVAPYLPEYKIAPSIHERDRPRPENVAAGQHLLDAFLFDGGSTDRVVRAIEAAGGHDVVVMDDRPIGGNARVRFVLDDTGGVDAIADVADVRWIEPVAQLKLDHTASASVLQSGDQGSAPLWDKGLHGEGQVIGMMDGGPLDINHCFFADAPPNTPGPTHRKVLELRNVSASPPAAHATFVAGIAAGDERNNSGANVDRGGAWAAKLISGNTTDFSGTTLLAELNRARLAGAFVHTNSWHDSTAPPGQPPLYNQNAADVDNFTFTWEDHVLFGSAGNNGEELGPPGTAKNAICIASAVTGNNPTTIGDGNTGPTADGRQKPDLASVGCEISSALVNTPCGTGLWGGAAGVCATSFATPNAAAAAALVRQYFTEGWYPSGQKVAANAFTPTGNLLRAALVASAIDMTGIPGYPNQTEGWGLIRLNHALFFPGANRMLTVFDVRHAQGPTNGETRTHTFNIAKDTEQLRVVMTFNDPSPAAGAFANPTVNDLDLYVTAPDGTLYLGNDFANGVSQPNSPAVGDNKATIEVVAVNSPHAGKWTIEVKAFRVAVGNPGQGYAIAVSAQTKSGCFVATTVYGDPDHADVQALRAYRDRTIRRGGVPGATMRVTAAVYNHVGPVAASVIAHMPRVRRFLRERALPALAHRVDTRAVRWH